MQKIVLACCLLIFVSCGSGGTGFPSDVPTKTNPLINTVSPESAPIGTEITIEGIGFSDVYPNNIVILGDDAIPATSYDFIEDPVDLSIEKITFNIPDDIAEGVYDLIVFVHNRGSNVVEFEVTK